MSDSRGRFAASISEILRPDEPMERVAVSTAGVAVVVRNAHKGDEVLLIRRAERSGDPWSGQVAFPGGRVEPGDRNFRQTAERESAEETGVRLDSARFVGYLNPFQARTRSIWVVPSVFLLESEQTPRPNGEVSSYRWVSFEDILAEENRTTYTIEWGARKREFPAFDLDGYLVWGLTERILTTMVDAIRRFRQEPSGRD